jgi:hypothetical protein
VGFVSLNRLEGTVTLRLSVAESADEKVHALQELGRLEAARDLARSVHVSRVRILGEQHPDTASSQRLVLAIVDEMNEHSASPKTGRGSG